MRKLLLISFFILLLPSLLLAQDKSKTRDVGLYILATSGVVPINDIFINIDTPIGRNDTPPPIGYSVGGIIGYQFRAPFALELGYSYNNTSGDIKAKRDFQGFKFDYTRRMSVTNNDIKFNVLFQPVFSVTENSRILPYIGVGGIINIMTIGLGASESNINIPFINVPQQYDNAISTTEPYSGATIKAGLRYRYKYFMIGAGAEVNLRFQSIYSPLFNHYKITGVASTISVNLDIGVMF